MVYAQTDCRGEGLGKAGGWARYDSVAGSLKRERQRKPHRTKPRFSVSRYDMIHMIRYDHARKGYDDGSSQFSSLEPWIGICCSIQYLSAYRVLYLRWQSSGPLHGKLLRLGFLSESMKSSEAGILCRGPAKFTCLRT